MPDTVTDLLWFLMMVTGGCADSKSNFHRCTGIMCRHDSRCQHFEWWVWVFFFFFTNLAWTKAAFKATAAHKMTQMNMYLFILCEGSCSFPALSSEQQGLQSKRKYSRLNFQSCLMQEQIQILFHPLLPPLSGWFSSIKSLFSDTIVQMREDLTWLTCWFTAGFTMCSK